MCLPSFTLVDGQGASLNAETHGRERGGVAGGRGSCGLVRKLPPSKDLIGLYGCNFCGPHGGVGLSPPGVGAGGCGLRARCGGRERRPALRACELLVDLRVKGGGQGGCKAGWNW